MIRVPRRAGAEHLPREQVGELLRAELEDLAVRVGLSAKSEVRVDRGDADEGGEDAEVGVGRDPHLLELELVLAPLVVVVDLLHKGGGGGEESVTRCTTSSTAGT